MTLSLDAVPTARGRLPIVGHIASLARRPLGFLQSLRAEGEIVRVWLGTMPAYLINAPHLLHELMVEKVSAFEKGRFLDKARSFVGNGITVTSGETHRKRRRMLQPAFSHVNIEHYAEIMADLAAAKANSWQAGQTLRFDQEMHDLTLAIGTRTLVSSDLEAMAGPVMRHAVPVIMEALPLRTLLPDALEKLPTPGNRKFARYVARLHAAIDQTITAYRRDGKDRDDLLSQLVAARDPETGEALSDEEIRDEVMAVLIGSYGAVMYALDWLFLELDSHPAVEQRVHEEVRRVVESEKVAYRVLAQLPYTRQVVHEVLRLHHVALMLMRRTVRSVELGGFSFPRGVELMFAPAALHRDPHLYPDPLRFDPDRWSPGWKERLPPGAFIPFSIGPHQCIGTSFAMTEMLIVVATIAARWKLRKPAGTRIREIASAMIRPDHAPLEVLSR